ncbi:MAG: esterase family protein [Atopobiaceae bacterium]|nr:esterase family protein [Atopobiaceae bacterium]
MKREYYKQHSDVLNEDMSMIVYGEGGYPVIAFQCQDSKSNNFEDFGMIDVLAPFINDGRIQIFSVDNLDEESWSDEGGDKGARAWRQEEYFKFVTDELVPRVHAWNNSDLRPLAVGCSMGATHAAIAALRRPDLFQGCIALSGVYSTRYFFGDWMDENLYNNDIPAFLTNMPADHPYVDLYNQRQLVMCVGQGAWELGIDDLHYIDGQLNRLGVKHWCDFWGTDVNHDWPWWRKQMPYFMNEVLNDITAQNEAAAKAEPEQAPAPVVEEAKQEAKAPAKKPAAKRTTTLKAAPKATATKATAAKKTTAAATKKAAAKATEAKAEATAETKAEATAETKAEATAETKAEATAETKAEAVKPSATKAASKRATTVKKTTASKAPAAKATAAKTATKTTAAKSTTARKATAAKTSTTKAAATKKATAATKKAEAADTKAE